MCSAIQCMDNLCKKPRYKRIRANHCNYCHILCAHFAGQGDSPDILFTMFIPRSPKWANKWNSDDLRNNGHSRLKQVPPSINFYQKLKMELFKAVRLPSLPSFVANVQLYSKKSLFRSRNVNNWLPPGASISLSDSFLSEFKWYPLNVLNLVIECEWVSY